MKCSRCVVAVDGLEFVGDIFVDDPKLKTYYFYQFSKEAASFNMGLDINEEKGPTASIGVSVPAGSPLIKVLRRRSQQHMCVSCFEKRFPHVFKSVALSLHGTAYFVNSDYTLNKAAYGAGRK